MAKIGHTPLTPMERAWKENRARLVQEAKFVMDAAIDEALVELDAHFREAMSRGEILRLESTKEELRQLLLASSQKALAPAPNGEAGNEV